MRESASSSMARKGNTVPITPSVLEWAMAEAGVTVDALAAKTKVPAGEVREWLADEQKPTLTQFRRLASALSRIPSVFLLPGPPPPQWTLQKRPKMDS